MKTQYYTASSLDGFIAGPGDSLDWLFALGDPEESSYPDFISDIGAIAMGSATYEWVLRHTLQASEYAPWPYSQPTWVFSSRARSAAPGADVRFAEGDVRAAHAEMAAAARGKNLWLAGGGDLVGQFYDGGLLDEIIVQIGSATLGAGKPFLPRSITGGALYLTSVRQLGGEFVELRYDVRYDRTRPGTRP